MKQQIHIHIAWPEGKYILINFLDELLLLNNMRMSKWWHNIYFWLNHSFKCPTLTIFTLCELGLSPGWDNGLVGVWIYDMADKSLSKSVALQKFKETDEFASEYPQLIISNAVS